MTSDAVRAATRAWIEEFIIGWGLCPFARGPWVDERVRIHVSEASDDEALLEDLVAEVLRLLDADPAALETTILVHPWVLERFEAQLDFMGAVRGLLEQLDPEMMVQVVSFHPDHRFGDAVDEAEHFANRAPYPCLHLLREAGVEAAARAHPDIAEVPANNARRLRAEGSEALATFFERLRVGAT